MDAVNDEKFVDSLVDMLNAALSEEWLAYYQYWIGAKVMIGPNKQEVSQELLIHANEELNHSVLLANRILQLNRTPVIDPIDWFKLAKCKYLAPTDTDISVIVEQNRTGETCAIQRYQEILDFTENVDNDTYAIAQMILADEIEHEKDLAEWLDKLKNVNESVIDFERACNGNLRKLSDILKR